MSKVNALSLPIILCVFFALATAGVFYNYPFTDAIGDETVLTAASLKMLAEPSLRPDYPTNYHLPFGAYLYLPFFAVLLLFLRFSGLFPSIDSLIQFGILEYGKLLPMARGVSIILGLASVYLVYRICRILFTDASVGLVAAFLLATDAMFVFLSHFGKVWVPQIFTILLALYYIVKFYRAPIVRLRDYALIGFLIVAAFATHIVGVLVYLPFLVAHYYKNAGKTIAQIFVSHKHLIVLNIVVIVGIAVTYYLNPYGFQNYLGQSSAAAHGLIGSPTTPAGTANHSQGFFFYAVVLWEYVPLLLFFSFVGAYRLFRKAPAPLFILLSFVVVYYVAIGPFLGSMRAIPHYISPIIPILSIIAAYGLVFLFREYLVARPKIVRIALVSLFILASLYPPLLFDYRLMQETTEQQFMRWLPAHIPAGAKIVNFNALFPLPEDRASIELTKRFNPEFLLRRQEYLLTLPDAAYPRPNYFVFQPGLYRNGIPPEIDKRQFDFAVLSLGGYGTYDDIVDRAWEFGVSEEKLIAIFPSDATKETRGGDPENIRRPLLSLPRMTHTGLVIAVFKLK